MKEGEREKREHERDGRVSEREREREENKTGRKERENKDDTSHPSHSSQAMYEIPRHDPPKLAAPQNWSVNFQEFIGLCLQKDPDKRPAAKRLLEVGRRSKGNNK